VFLLVKLRSVEPNLPPVPVPPGEDSSEQAKSDYKQLILSFEEIRQTVETRYENIRQSFHQSDTQFQQGYVELVAVNGSGLQPAFFLIPGFGYYSLKTSLNSAL
jgi:hypothetical protein